MESLFKDAKTRAEESFLIAEREFNIIKDMPDKQIISEVQALLLKIKNAMEQNSYFGYLDAEGLSETLIAKCREVLNEKKKRVAAYASKFHERIRDIITFLDDYKYKRLSEPLRLQAEGCYVKVKRIMESIAHWIPSSTEAIDLACRDVDRELESIEAKLENLVYIKRSIKSLSVFGKWVFFSLCSVIVLCFIIFPLFAHYLEMVSNRFSLAQSFDIWHYQKIFFVWGSVVSILLSVFVSIKSFIKGDT